MSKIDFTVGSEDRAINFLKGISDEDKVAVISHTDLDGISAAKIITSYVSPKFLKFVDYEDLRNGLDKELKDEQINKVIFSDLSMSHPEIIKKVEKFAEILIIDHHVFSEDLNSDKTIFLSVEGYCAGYLCYYLVSKVKDIGYFDWLAAIASIADWQYFNNKEFMGEIMKKYGDEFELDGETIRKSGKFWDLQWKLVLAIIYFNEKDDLKVVYDSIGQDFGDIGELGKYSDVVQKEIDEQVVLFDEKYEQCGEVCMFRFQPKFPISSIVTTLVSARKDDEGKTFILGRDDEGYLHISARRQDGKIDLPKLLKKATKDLKDGDGGGHIKAAGASILAEDWEKFKKNIVKFHEDYIL